MPNLFKTPLQMMYENAGLPHYSGAKESLVRGGADVLGQFASRVQNAIRQYTKAAGKPPSAEEVKALEDHILSLTKPSPQAPMTQARAAAQEPFANKLVDQSGRPYSPVPHPQTGKLVTPERAMAPEMRDQFGSTPSNYSIRSATMEPPHVNAFPEDEFMSMANTGRASNRTWNKSYTPSAEELAQRQHMAEDVGMPMGEGEDLGGLAQARVSEGDIPQMTSASAPFAERSGALEAGALNQLSGDILQGKHAKTIESVIADFRSRGIEPDREDILNAINAQINPLRHNYTGENPIGLRPSLPSGARSTPEMEQWRDAMRMSGQPETTVTTHPSDWNAAPKRDYLIDTEEGARQPFAKDWDIQQLEDRRRRGKAAIGEIQSSPNDIPVSNIGHGYAAGGQISPRDMQAHMMVNGYGRGGMPAKKPFAPEYGVGRAAAQGLTMGWSDEAEAAARAAAGEGTYEGNLAKLSKARDTYMSEHPIAGTVAELAGGAPYMAIPALGMARAAGAAKNIGPMMRAAKTILPSVALDATFGGIQGAGQAEPGKRLEGAAHDAMFNAGFNVAGTAALGAVPAYKAAKKAIRESRMNPEAKLAEKVAGKPFDYTAGMTAPSDAARQEWIGKAHDVGANAFKTNDPAYKAAVFNAHREAGHPLITEHGAQNYDQMMKMAYENLGKETATQARAIPNKMEFWGDTDYANKDYLARAKEMGIKPAELMRQELTQGKPMQVYKDTLTEANPGHPYLANIDPVTGATQNELFRGVHDYFGHLGTKTPNTFGPKGEENAWLAHRQMYSPLAEPAATAETRGQNSYVNYVNEINRKLRAEGKPTTEFAKNLPVLLPPEASDPKYLGGLPSYLKGIVP